MSSGIQSIIQLDLFNNAVSVACIVIVTYDYILTFPKEVEYIWSKSWTSLSTLFLIVRYVGIYTALSNSLSGNTLVPGPLKTCIGLIYSFDWALAVFICASNLFMVLRVYAIWNRSKVILGILLLSYSVQVILQVVIAAVFENPYTDATVSINQVLNYSACSEVFYVIAPYYKYVVIYPTLFDLLLLVLALIPTMKESTAMYKATKRLQLNRYMSLIVKEGILYVLLNLFNNIPNAILNADGNSLLPVWFLISFLFYVSTMFPVMPRFVLSIRELYANNTLRYHEGIDSGFGISSRARNIAGHDTSLSVIAFAEGRNGSDEEGDEEMQLEPIGGLSAEC